MYLAMYNLPLLALFLLRSLQVTLFISRCNVNLSINGWNFVVVVCIFSVSCHRLPVYKSRVISGYAHDVCNVCGSPEFASVTVCEC